MTTSAPPPPGRRAPPWSTGIGRVTLLAFVLAGAAAGLLALVDGLGHLERPASIPWPALALLFAATEVFVIHLHIRRGAHSISLSEVPLVVGLAFTAPIGFVAARILGAGIALVLHRKQVGIKLWFNVSHLALEACLAVLVYRAVLGDHDQVSPWGWLAAFVTTIVTDIYAACVITAAISLFERSFDRLAFVQVLGAGVVAALTNTSLALVAVVVIVQDGRAVLLLSVVAVVLFLAYRAYTSQSAGYARLELLYGFTRAVGSTVQADEVTRAVLSEARHMLRAEVAQMVVLAADGAAAVCTSLGPDDVLTTSPAPPPEEAWWGPAAEGTGMFVARSQRDESVRGALATAGLKDALAAPLRGDSGPIGVLLVGNRLDDVSTFDGEDLKLFETLANHASVSLENGRLVDRLRTEVSEKEHQSLHDALTGLPNRRLFSRCVDEALAGGAAAVMLLDLDRFKEINDTLGHHTGDELLREVGKRLAALSRGRATIARLGGDEFALLLPQPGSVAEAKAEAKEVVAALERPFLVGDVTLDVGASLGVALAPDHGDDAALLLQRADVAMYAAKGRRSGVEVYDPEDDQYSPWRLALVGELRRAIEGRELAVHYQPKAELATGRVTGVEALVRWQHAERGPVGPDEFVPLAEHTGLIRPLTLFVLEEAIGQAAKWRRQGRPLSVAVNLSVRSLLDAALPDDVARLLVTSGLPASALILEITESTIMGDPTRTIEVLSRLSSLGLSLSIDDFGTGYSSLSYLKRLPVDEVKIDRSFVMNMAVDGDDDAIVRSTIDLGHNLGLRVVAEGVEEPEAWARLADLGCDVAQGYLLSRPVPAAQLDAWLALREEAYSTAVPAR